MGVITENPDKWPGAYGGSREECRAWLEKDAAIKRAALETSPAKRTATTGKSTAELVSDLPMSAASLRKALARVNPENREVFLMKLLVGNELPADVIVTAQAELYGAQILDLMHANSELEEEIRSLKTAQNRAEREIIDALADKLFDFTKEFVVSECKRRVESLQAKVLSKSAQIRHEGEAIEQLNAKTVLLDGRVRYLELTSPIFVTANTRSPE
jgi:predicted RNase H-like nuclease (RuvC/YqgF family)